MNLPAPDHAEVSSDIVELAIPRGHRHIATARLLAASIGADAGLDVDQIDDLRLAVDEAVAVVVEAATPSEAATSDARVVLRFAADAGGVTVRVASGPDATVLTRAHIDPLALRILEAVADGFEVADGALVITKRTAAADDA